MTEKTISAEHTVTPETSYSGAALTWLNARPNTPFRADLSSLNDDFAIRCVLELTNNQQFDLPLVTNHPASDWLNHFYFEARNLEKVFGTKNLGIGYPFVLANLSGHKIAAPLFVWQFSLEPHAQNPDNWIFQRNVLHNIVPNYTFFHLIDNLFGTDFSLRARQLAESKTLNASILADLCEGIRLMLRLVEDGLPLSIQPFTDPELIENHITEGRLLWSAVAGIYPSLPRTVVTQPPSVAPDLPADASSWSHQFTLLNLDPTQRFVLSEVQKSALTVIEGASGSGKTYLAAAIAINALSNGKKCLFVSKNISALRNAQKFLLDKGVGDLSFVVRDLEGDKLMLADMLRMTAESKNKAVHNQEVYKTTLNKTNRELNKLDNAWEALHTPLFKGLSFTETTGRYMRANRMEGKELLLSQLNIQDFAFNEEEYDEITRAIYSSEPLFRRFPTLNHPLNDLNFKFFSGDDVKNGITQTETTVDHLSHKLTSLHHNYLTTINDYAESLLDHYEQYHAELARYVKRIKDGLEDGVTRFGADFEKPISNSEKIYGVISDRYKDIVAAKEKIGVIFEEMRRAYAQRKYFEFDFPSHFDNRNIRKISELTQDFDAAMSMWRKRLGGVVREDVRRLNAKSMHPDLEYRERIKAIEQEMDQFIDHFNAEGLYNTAIKHEMLTLPKRQEFLESVLTKIEETQFYLRDFEDFYVWQHHWLGLSGPAQKVIRALCKVKPKNWQTAFESWYLHHLLQKAFQPNLIWDESTLANYSANIRELREYLPGQISHLWQDRKNNALKSLKSTDAKAYKNWFGKDNRTLCLNLKAEDLFKQHIYALTETLPVLLVTPEVALDVVQNSNQQYDLVLVDEGHNISKQECYHLFELAKHLVVFGDSRQDMTPFADDDILEFCKGIGAKTHNLDYMHQDSPEGWVRFNKIAFGTPFKRLPTGRSALDSTVVANVEGRFDENTLTNEAEARQIIDWLNLIEPTRANTYPSVGIACATVQQRDLIAGQLLKIRQKKMAGYEKIQQLYLNGLGVYQFGEMQGQHFDVILLSLTHGITDAHGTLTHHLHFWNTPLGFNQLHVVLTRATQKVYVAHSIPDGLYAVLAADRNFIGTCILSHLVTFADHLQRGDARAAEDQLQQMKVLLNYADSYFDPTIFSEEIELALRPYFAADQMKRSAFPSGVRVPLFIEGREDEPSSVLAFDGVLIKAGLPSYEWEDKTKAYFQKLGISYAPVYATQWWRSPSQEARKLAARLLKG